MIQTKDINIWSIAILCALPVVYVVFEELPIMQGILIGMLLMKKMSDIQKYGLRAIFMLPTSTQVEQIY